uniref:Secreted protein n=1 Tax=Knipowitschia caucasica TaxID=637954 RepID=A0AAV2M3R9_KNICA
MLGLLLCLWEPLSAVVFRVSGAHILQATDANATIGPSPRSDHRFLDGCEDGLNSWIILCRWERWGRLVWSRKT